jgi:hypothetical protein
MADGLIASAIAAAGAFVGWGQLRLAQQRSRLDLYDRRYRIFAGARKLLDEILLEGFAGLNVVFAYRRETGDAIFLLSRDVTLYLEDLGQRAFRLVRIRTLLANDAHPDREAMIDEEADLQNWFAGQHDVLAEAFRPTLQLEHPWNWHLRMWRAVRTRLTGGSKRA